MSSLSIKSGFMKKKNEQVDGWRWIDRWMDGWMDGYGWLDGWIFMGGSELG